MRLCLKSYMNFDERFFSITLWTDFEYKYTSLRRNNGRRCIRSWQLSDKLWFNDLIAIQDDMHSANLLEIIHHVLSFLYSHQNRSY